MKTDTRRERDFFVENHVYPMLYAINHNVLYAEYEVGSDGEEYVTITYASPMSARRVKVTDHSLAELAGDVLKCLD